MSLLEEEQTGMFEMMNANRVGERPDWLVQGPQTNKCDHKWARPGQYIQAHYGSVYI